MTTIEIRIALIDRYRDVEGDRAHLGHDYTEGYLDCIAWLEALIREEYGQG